MLNGSKITKVAFFFENTGSWEGEKNYLNSLISALDFYNHKNFQFLIFTSKKNYSHYKRQNFKNIKIYQSSFFTEKNILNIIRKISSRIFNIFDPIIYFFIKKYNIDIISHYIPNFYCKTVCWMPDFQHMHFPQNFDNKELNRRDKLYNHLINRSTLLILSSNDSIKDLKKFTKKKIKFKKLNFVPRINFENLKKINPKKNYSLKKKYFIVPNQFWKHKNHILLINTVKILDRKNIDFQIVLTGEKKSQKNKNVYLEFNNLLKKNNLEKYFCYLGKIAYDELINLIYNSHALINPSFFEGWSTTVEEAKIFQKNVILSNISVHKEQNPKNSFFFNPHSSKQLSKIIFTVSKRKNIFVNKKKLKKMYNRNRYEFAENYINILKKI